jgi:arylsulfatase A-like enzyme
MPVSALCTDLRCLRPAHFARRCFFALSLTLIISAEALAEVPSEQETLKRRPNVLLIVADDLGYGDLGINNPSAPSETPNLDAFAREGLRFTRHYASPVCSPARVELLTGQYAARFGFTPNGRGIPAEVTTLPERLAAAGYSTWHIGKWHIGDTQREAWPDYQGFEHWFGFLNQWRLAGQHRNGALALSKPRYHTPWLQGDDEPGRHVDGHLNDILTDSAIAAIDKMSQDGKPWFLNLWYYAPHAPIQPAPAFTQPHNKSPEGQYRALLNQLDHNIGRLLARLRTDNQYDSTLIVFVSDNGGTNRAMDNNSPYTGGKGMLAEGGLRTPLLIRRPGEIRPGTVTTQLASIRDLYPTILGELDIALAQPVDGLDLARADENFERNLYWEHNTGFSVLYQQGQRRWSMIPATATSPAYAEYSDLNRDASGSAVATNPDSTEQAALLGELGHWYREVHRVELTDESSDTDKTYFSGMDFVRSPGFGDYTVAFNTRGDSTGKLLQQGNGWEISRQGDSVTVILDEYSLTGAFSSTASCHSVALSAKFNRKISGLATAQDNVELALYLDGRRVEHLAAPGRFEPADLGQPLALWRGRSATADLLIYTATLWSSPFLTPQHIHQTLCTEPSHADI